MQGRLIIFSASLYISTSLQQKFYRSYRPLIGGMVKGGLTLIAFRLDVGPALYQSLVRSIVSK